ncbi:Golgi transport complex subunit 1 [Geranomyces variabilis]|uniref:Conserved oligomeric Golgi complex subunit 1 n=1 Tax=Geranomyces variabilis TaxID=109894 RepID=A0AAD5XR51_9FUNG|nr:Golgi transport complex subunit 1 [Geranomyces variabilis]
MPAPTSRKNSSFPPPPLAQSQSRIFDSFLTKRAVLADTAVLVNEDPDAVFEKYPVVEVRALLARTTVDIERKKQDLRVMVGERYRDLIDAADAIKTMSVAASEVDATFLAMRDGCDAQAIRRKAAEGKAKEAGGSGKERRNTGVYAVAAQIKVLVDTPEQIWHAMEDDAYLKACSLYLVARQVYENLSTAEDSASLRPLHSFPVVKRQWNAVSHFRAQIVERSTSHLAKLRQTSQNISETLCAIILLTRATQHDMLKKLLTTRHSTLTEMTKTTTPSSPDIAGRIIALVEAIHHTLTDVQQLFFQDSSPSLLSATVVGLSPPSGQKGRSMSDLYKDKTNLHIIYRHLPTSIAAFRPRVDPTSSVRVPLEAARMEVEAWEVGVRELVAKAVGGWLSVLDKATVLSDIWTTVIRSVKSLETNAAEQQHALLCQQLFGARYSIWTNVLRTPFIQSAESLIKFSLHGLATQPDTMIKPMLAGFGNISQPDRHVTEYMWSAENFAAGNIDLEDTAAVVYRGETPSLASLGAAFENVIRAVKSDSAPLFETPLGARDGNADPHMSQIDAVHLFNSFRTILGQAVFEYREGLDAILTAAEAAEAANTEGDDEISHKAETVDKCLFVGRVGRSVALRIRRLGTVLRVDKPGQTGWSSALDAVAADISSWERALLSVYDAAHSFWISIIAARMFSAVAAEAARVSWAMAEFTVLWDNGSPSQPSSFVTTTLFDLCREWNRVAGFTLEKNTLVALMAECHKRIKGLYETLLPSAPSPQAAMQMAFDYVYFGTVLAPADPTRNSAIDSALLEPVANNVAEFWRSTGTLFGAFLIAQGANTGPSSRPPTASSDLHNILPMAKPPPRFTLLPVPYALPASRKLQKQHSHPSSVDVLQGASSSSSAGGGGGSASNSNSAVNTTTTPPPLRPANRRVSLIPDSAPKPPTGGAGSTGGMGGAYHKQGALQRGIKPPGIRLRGPALPPKAPAPAPVPQGLGKTFEVLTSGARSALSGVLDYAQISSPVMGRRKPPGT